MSIGSSYLGNSYGQNLQSATNTAYSNTVSYGLNPALNGGVDQQAATGALGLVGLIPGAQQLGANGMIGGVPISELGLPGLSDSSSMFGPAASVSMFDSATNNGSSLVASSGGQSGLWNYADALDPNGISTQLQQQQQQSQVTQLQQQNAQLQQELAMQQGGGTGGVQQQQVSQQQTGQVQPAQSQQSSMWPMIMMLVIVLVVLQQQKQQSDSSANSLSGSQLDTIMQNLGLTATTNETDADKLTAIQSDKSKLDTLATTLGANTSDSISDEWNNISAKESTVDQVLQAFKLDPTKYNTIQDKLNALNVPTNNVKTTADGMWKQLGTDPTTFTNPFAEESGLLSKQSDIQALLTAAGVPNASSLTTIPEEYNALNGAGQLLPNIIKDMGLAAPASNATTQDDITELNDNKTQLDKLATDLNLNPSDYQSALAEATAIDAQKSILDNVLQAFKLDPTQYSSIQDKLTALNDSNNNVKTTADNMWRQLGTDPTTFTNPFAEESGLLSKQSDIQSLLTAANDPSATTLNTIPDELTAINNDQASLTSLLQKFETVALGDANLQGVISTLSPLRSEAEYLLTNVNITPDPSATDVQTLQTVDQHQQDINNLVQSLGLTYLANAPYDLQYQGLKQEDTLLTNQLQALSNLPAGTDLSTMTISQKEALLLSLTPLG